MDEAKTSDSAAAAGEPLDVLVNGTLVAHGEIVIVNDRFGIRLTDVVPPGKRVGTNG